MKARFLLLILSLTCFGAALNAAVPAASGTLQARQEQYYPQGCVHNGNHAICGFVLVNQGQLLTLNAASALWGVQFVDSGHVPHGADSAYFLDQWGSRQAQLVLQHNDRALLAVEFVNVDPAVAMGEFHLGNQIVAGIQVAQPVYNAPQEPNGAMLASGGQMPGAPATTAPTGQQMAGVPGQQVAYAQPNGGASMQQTATAQSCVPQGNGGAGNALCNASNKMNNTQNQVANGAAQMSQSVQALGQMGAALRGMFGQRQSAPPAAPAAVSPQPMVPGQVPVAAAPAAAPQGASRPVPPPNQ